MTVEEFFEKWWTPKELPENGFNKTAMLDFAEMYHKEKQCTTHSVSHSVSKAKQIIDKIIDDLPVRDMRSEMSRDEWYAWFEESFNKGYEEALRQFSVSGVVCPKCKSDAIAEYPDYKECRICGNVW